MNNNSVAWRELAPALHLLRACRGIAGLGLTGLVVAAAFLPPAIAADVYVSRSSDGVPVYTNRAPDASYRLFLKGADERGAVSGARGPVKENVDMRKRREALEPLIQEVSVRHGLDPSLVRAIAHVESQFNAGTVSPAGAKGVMQLMPATAKRYGTADRGDPAQNLEAGARYFKDLLNQYAGNIALALAAYNSGESNVERHAKRVPPFRETMLYVPEVLTRYESYRRAEAEKTK